MFVGRMKQIQNVMQECLKQQTARVFTIYINSEITKCQSQSCPPESSGESSTGIRTSKLHTIQQGCWKNHQRFKVDVDITAIKKKGLISEIKIKN